MIRDFIIIVEMGFLSFLLGRDVMGHSFSLTYKGNTSHPTMVGAVLTIGIQLLVVFQLAQ